MSSQEHDEHLRGAQLVGVGVMTRDKRAPRFGWQVAARLSAVVLVVAAAVRVLLAYIHPGSPGPLVDFEMYRDAAARWLATGVFYLPHQLAGPYTITHGDVLYPPPTLLLFVPTALLPHALAAAAFVGVPLAVLAWTVRRHRPAPWALALVGLCLWWPIANQRIVAANPALWAMAAVALGTVRPAFAPFALLKVTVGLWAFGAWRREWWAGLAIVVALAVLFLPMWPDWITVMRNSNGSVVHSLTELPLVLAPAVAWAGRRQPGV